MWRWSVLTCPLCSSSSFMSQLLCSPIISNLPSPVFTYYPPSSTVIPWFSPCTSSFLGSRLPSSLFLSGKKKGRSSLLVTFDKQIKLEGVGTKHMPVRRRCNAVYTHCKALSCDHSGMLIKPLCEDGSALCNYEAGMCVSNMCVCLYTCQCGFVRVSVPEWFHVCLCGLVCVCAGSVMSLSSAAVNNWHLLSVTDRTVPPRSVTPCRPFFNINDFASLSVSKDLVHMHICSGLSDLRTFFWLKYLGGGSRNTATLLRQCPRFVF